MNIASPTDYKVKRKESEKISENLDLTRELKNAEDHEGDADTNCSWYVRNGPKGFEKEKTEGTGNNKKNLKQTDHSIF